MDTKVQLARMHSENVNFYYGTKQALNNININIIGDN